MADASSRASLILEIVDLDSYRAGMEAARKATEDLTAAQAAVKPIQRAAVKATDEAAASAKRLADVEKMVEKAYVAALPPAEKTALVIEKLSGIQTDNLNLQFKIGVALAANTKKYEDQFRRQEMNRGSQHGLSRSLAELLDEQTKAQVAAIAAGAAMLKEGLSAQKVSVAIEHLRDTTSEADKKTEAYREEVARLETQLRQVTAAEKANSAAQVAAAEHYDVTKRKLDAVETAMEGLRIPGAEIVTSMKRMSDAMETANKTLTPMQVKLLKGAIAVGAMAAAAAAAVAGVAAIGAALVANSAAADEWNEDLRAVGLNLDAVGTLAVNRAAAGIDAVSVAGKLLGVTIAETMAPAVEQVSTVMVAMGLAAVDVWKNFDAGRESLTVISNIVAIGLVGAFDALISPLKNTALAMALISDTIGMTKDAAARLNEGFREFSDTMVERATVAVEDYARNGLGSLTAATGDYMAQAAELVGKQEAINRATRAQTEAAVEATTAWELYQNKAVGANSEVLKATEKTAAGMASANKGAFGEIKAASASAAEAEKANAEQFASFMIAQTTAVLGQVGALAGSVMSLTNLAEDGMTKMWKAMFVVQKAAALSSIAVSTAANISAAALAFAFPSPAGIAAVAAVAALGALQAATVAVSAFGEYKGAQTSAGGGSSGGGGASSSSGGGGGSLSLGGGGGFMSSQASSPASYGGGGPAPLAIPSSDGYFPPTMGGRTIQTAPGDEAYVQRGGALNRSNQGGDSVGFNAEIASLLRALLTEAKGGRQDSRMRLHFAAATGPARGY